MHQAFEAPMFRHCSSNANAREIAREIGATKVRYGISRSDAAHGAKTKLALAEPSAVERPRDGSNVDV